MPIQPAPGEFNYRHHNQTPIAQLAKNALPSPRRWFNRGERVVVEGARPAYLNGELGTVVALQTSAIVVQLDDSPTRNPNNRYFDENHIARFSSRVLHLDEHL